VNVLFINNSIKQIIKYKNISIIYRNYESSDEEEFKKIFKLSKKKNIPLFVAYNELLIKKYSCNGFYIPSFVRKKIYVNKKILLRAIDQPKTFLTTKPLPLHLAAYRLGEARLEIYDICDIKDNKCSVKSN
jgi:hypothetical protein